MRNEINLTDEQIEARFESLGYMLTIEDVVFTRETLDHFRQSRSGYAQPGRLTSPESDALVIEGVQVNKGDRRRDVLVIDFGTVRGVYNQ